MGRHNELGKEGEEKAVAFLQEKGYVILEKNYRSGRAEVDIIAGFKDIIVFVEVKTRSSYVFGYPEESVTSTKPVSYTHLRAHETVLDLVCRLLLEKKKEEKKNKKAYMSTH